MRTLQCRSQLYFVIPGVMTPLGLLLLLLPLLVTSIRQEDRVDCQPGEPGDSNICAARGCLWDQAGLENLLAQSYQAVLDLLVSPKIYICINKFFPLYAIRVIMKNKEYPIWIHTHIGSITAI